MPLPTQHRIICVNCKTYIKTVRLGDAIDANEFHMISHSLCSKCKGTYWQCLLQKIRRNESKLEGS